MRLSWLEVMKKNSHFFLGLIADFPVTMMLASAVFYICDFIENLKMEDMLHW
jgi:hypothetical protein